MRVLRKMQQTKMKIATRVRMYVSTVKTRLRSYRRNATSKLEIILLQSQWWAHISRNALICARKERPYFGREEKMTAGRSVEHTLFCKNRTPKTLWSQQVTHGEHITCGAVSSVLGCRRPHRTLDVEGRTTQGLRVVTAEHETKSNSSCLQYSQPLVFRISSTLFSKLLEEAKWS